MEGYYEDFCIEFDYGGGYMYRELRQSGLILSSINKFK
jgi:hypothetical protein